MQLLKVKEKMAGVERLGTVKEKINDLEDVPD